MWEIASSRCYLASYVSRSLPASADGALLVADFGSKSATVELGVCRQLAGPLLAATPASQPWLFPLLMSKIYRDYRSSMSLVPRSAAATRSVDSRLDIHIFQ